MTCASAASRQSDAAFQRSLHLRCECLWRSAAVSASRGRYTKPSPKRPAVQYPFSVYAERAIAKLKAEAAAETVKGKDHKFLTSPGGSRTTSSRAGVPPTSRADEHDHDWISDDYRVEDTEATIARYGRQPKGKGRQKVLKMPSVTTLGNLDWALRHVWLEAVADKIVDRRQRPMIDKTLGEDGEPRAFINSTGVQAVARVMTDAWIAGNGHTPDMKRMLAYLHAR